MKKQITNLRNKHIMIFIGFTALAASLLIPSDMKWLIYIGMVILAFGVSYFYGTGEYEKPDELARENYNRATRYTFLIAIAVLIVLSLMGSGAGDNGSVYDDIVTIPANIIAACAFGLIAVRSLLFVIIDNSDKGEEDE